MGVLFLQYIRPHGRVEEQIIDLDPEVEKKAQVLHDADFVFTAECLTNLPGNMVYFDIIREKDELVLGHTICVNGPKVPGAVTKMFEAAYTRWMKL